MIELKISFIFYIFKLFIPDSLYKVYTTYFIFNLFIFKLIFIGV